MKEIVMTGTLEEELETKERPRRYCVNIEGVEHAWFHQTIMVPQIRDLGCLPLDQPVLEINLEDNTERTLGECEVVHIKPGHAFCKKVRYKRG
jgi:hypothetical protein